MDYTLLLNAIPLPDGERPASNYTLNTKLNMKVLDFVQLGGPVIARVGFQAGQDSPGVTGAKLVLEVERDLKALGGHLPHGVRGDGRLSPVVGPVGPGGGDRPRQLAVGVVPSLRFQLREEPRDAVGVLCLPRPRVDAVTHVTSPALSVGREGRTPDAPRGRELGAVPVGDVAYALGGQRVAGVSPLSSSLDKAPGIDQGAHHLAYAPLGDAEPAGKVLTGDHRVVGQEVERPLLRRADAEGRRSLCHPLGTGQRRPFTLRRCGETPSAGAAARAHLLQCAVGAADPRESVPEAKVPSFQRAPRLHGDEAVFEVQSLAEPRRQPLLPDAGHQDQNGVGAAPVVVLRDGPQPVVEGAAPQAQALAHHAEAAAVVKGDGGVEAAPAVELHVGP